MTRRTQFYAARGNMAIAGNLMLAPMVIALRVPLMATEAQSSSPIRVETTRAIMEKTSAVAEGFVAAQMSFLKSAWQFWPEVLSGKTPAMLNGVAIERSVAAALRPVGRTVKANYKRLSAK